MRTGTLTAQQIAREVAVTVASILVVLYTASMVHPAEPQRALALTVVSTQPVAANTIVFYGTVVDKSTGRPVRGASVTLAKVNADGSLTRVASTVTDSVGGTFRISLSPATSGKYQLLVQADIATGTVRDAFPLSATSGHAYGLRAELINREYFSLLPLPGY